MKDKTAVVGMVERNGRLTAKAVALSREVITNVKEGATLYSDEWLGYEGLDRIYDHEFVNGRIHTNTIEGFWSILKRGIVGIYHFTSKKHLQRYVDEFAFRYNSRETSEAMRFNLLLGNMEHRLTYNQLING